MFRGSMVALITPFSDGMIDEEKLRELIDLRKPRPLAVDAKRFYRSGVVPKRLGSSSGESSVGSTWRM